MKAYWFIVCVSFLILIAFLSPKSVFAKSLTEQGIVAYKAKEYKLAAQYLEKALAQGDGSAECYLYLAHSYYASKDYAHAVGRYLDIKILFKDLPAGRQAASILSKIDPESKWTERVLKQRKAVKSSPVSLEKPSYTPDEMAGRYRDKRQVLSHEEYKQEYKLIPKQTRVPYYSKNTIVASINGKKIYARWSHKWETVLSEKDLKKVNLEVPSEKPDNSEKDKKTGKPNSKWKTAYNITIGGITRKVPVTVEKYHSGPPKIGRAFVEDLEVDASYGGVLTISKKSATLKKGMTDTIVSYKKEFSKLPDKAEIRFVPGSQGHMMVTAYINGKPIRCMFDTGASGFVGVKDCSRIGIKAPRSNDKPDGYTRGWAGRSVPVYNREANVKIGNLERVIPIRVSPAWRNEPLLGQEFLRDYMYSIDRAARIMTLHKKTSKSAKTKRKIHSLYDIPCVVENDREYVNIKINGRTCSKVLIDTGASSTIISAADAKSCGLVVPINAPRMRMSGVGGGITMRRVFVNISLGPIRKSGFPILVGGRAGSAIGQNFMTGWRFTVDREAKLLRFFH